MVKRIISILLVMSMILTMSFSFGIGTASAASDVSSITIIETAGDESQVITELTTDQGGLGWSWSAENQILTLDGFNGEYIETNGNISINLVGTNTVTMPANAPSGTKGIYAQGKLTITGSGTLNVNGLGLTTTAANWYGINASGLYINGGTVNIHMAIGSTRETGCFYGIDSATFVNNDASLSVLLEGNYAPRGINGYLTTNTSGNVSITIEDIYPDDNYKIAISNPNSYCTTRLEHSGTGTVTLSNKSACAIDANLGGDLIVSEGAGKVTLDGIVQLYSPSKVNYDIAGDMQYTSGDVILSNHRPVVNGSTLSRFVLCDVNGNVSTHNVLESVENAPLRLVDSPLYDFTSMTVGKYSGESWPIATGGTKPYTYSIDPEYPLPAGVTINASSGCIKGYPTTESEAGGAAKVVVTDKNGDIAYIMIDYSAVEPAPVYLKIDTNMNNSIYTTSYNVLSDASGSGWSYEAATRTLTLNGFTGETISCEQALNIVLEGTNTVTLPAGAAKSAAAVGVSGNLNISGSGTLNVDCLNMTVKEAAWRGIDANRVDIDGGTVNIHMSLGGIKASNAFYGIDGHVYVNNDANLNITMEGNYIPRGIGGYLYANTSGNVNITIGDNDPTDSYTLIKDYMCVCTAYLEHKGTGTVTLSNPDAFAIKSGVLKVGENAGTLTLEGLSTFSSSKGDCFSIPDTMSFATTGDLILNGGPVVVDGVTVYDYILSTPDKTPVKSAVLSQTANNELRMVDSSIYDLTDLMVGKSTSTMAFRVYGGTAPYTFSLDSNTSLPAGMQVYQSSLGAYLTGTPTTYSEDPGTARIIVTDSVGATASIMINYSAVGVEKAVTGVELSKSEMIMSVGDSQEITATVSPSDATVKTVDWSSDNEDIAVYKDGKIKAVGIGKATITATTTQGRKKAACDVYVREKTPAAYAYIYEAEIRSLAPNAEYTINGVSYTADENGYIPIEEEWSETTISIVKVNAVAKCNSLPQELEIGHVHFYITSVVGPTCSAQGYTKHECACGDYYLTDYVNKLAHTYEWVTDTPATYTSTGEKHEECSVCHEKRSMHTVIPILICNPHALTLVPQVDKTCSTDGCQAYYKCNQCGKMFRDAAGIVELTSLTVLRIPASHEYGSWIEEVPSTCIEAGTRAHYHCADCGSNFDEDKQEVSDITLPLGDHAYEWEIDTPATYLTTGIKHEECSVCHDATRNENTVIPALECNHSMTLVPQVDKTCSVDGCKAYYHCSVCNRDYKDVEGNVLIEDMGSLAIPAGHEYGDLIPKVPATCIVAGTIAHYTCADCGKNFNSEKVAVESLETPLAEHTYEWVADTPATHMATGIQHEECTVCHEKRNSNTTIPKLVCNPHDLTLVPEVDKTCTTDGCLAYYKCEQCGKMFRDALGTQEIEDLSEITVAASHEYGSWIEEVSSTCIETGTKAHYHCADCGSNFDEDKQAVSELTLPLGDHSYGSEIAEVPSTCTEEGVAAHYECSVCHKLFIKDGLTYTEVTAEELVLEKKAHSFNRRVESDAALAEEGTCTAPTKYYYSCRNCDAISDTLTFTTTIKEDVHSKVHHDRVEKSCTEDGCIAYEECTLCHKKWSLSGVLITDDASLTIPKGHVVEKIEAQRPTCTEDGNTEGTRCSKCEAVLEEPEIIPAKGHSLKETTTKASFSADGKIETKCTVCDTVLETKVLKKLSSVKLSTAEYTYDGKAKTPTVTVKDSAGKTITSAYYTLTKAAGRTNVGKYSYKLVFKGLYEGTKTVYFTINPKKAAISSAAAGKGKVTVKMSTKVASTGGSTYQIAYRVKGTSTWKTTTATSQTKSITGLKKGKKYEIKVRAYKSVNNTKYYGSYSAVKTSSAVK